MTVGSPTIQDCQRDSQGRRMHVLRGGNVNYFGEIVIICMFLLRKVMNMM